MSNYNVKLISGGKRQAWNPWRRGFPSCMTLSYKCLPLSSEARGSRLSAFYWPQFSGSERRAIGGLSFLSLFSSLSILSSHRPGKRFDSWQVNWGNECAEMCRAAVFWSGGSSGLVLVPAGSIAPFYPPAKSFLTVIGLQYTSEGPDTVPYGGLEWHCVYWEMISVLYDKITPQCFQERYTVMAVERWWIGQVCVQLQMSSCGLNTLNLYTVLCIYCL